MSLEKLLKYRIHVAKPAVRLTKMSSIDWLPHQRGKFNQVFETMQLSVPCGILGILLLSQNHSIINFMYERRVIAAYPRALV